VTDRVTIKTEGQALAYLWTIGHACKLERVPTAPGHDPVTVVVVKKSCRRCGGSGIYSSFHGVCYECKGRRPSWVEKPTVVVYARKVRTKELAAAKRVAKAAERERQREENALEGQRNWCERNTPYGRVTFAEKRVLEQADRDREQAAQSAVSKHVGEVGKRMELELELTFCKQVGQWERWLHVFTTPNGERVTYWGGESRLEARDLDPARFNHNVKGPMPVGYKFTCTAKIHEHREYSRKGSTAPAVPETVIKNPRSITPTPESLVMAIADSMAA